MPAPFRYTPARPAGFTLLEILVSVTLASMILLLAVQFLISLGEDWAGREEERLFDEHVDGVIRFFNHTMTRNAHDSRLPSEDRYPAVDQPEGYGNLNDPLIRIRFPDGSPLFGRDGYAGEPVTAWFGHREEIGLFALWRPDLEEDIDDYRDFYHTVITPWGNRLRFCYYDAENDLWEIEEDIRMDGDNQPVFPRRIEVTFIHEDGMERTLILPLPHKESNAFTY